MDDEVLDLLIELVAIDSVNPDLDRACCTCPALVQIDIAVFDFRR